MWPPPPSGLGHHGCLRTRAPTPCLQSEAVSSQPLLAMVELARLKGVVIPRPPPPLVWDPGPGWGGGWGREGRGFRWCRLTCTEGCQEVASLNVGRLEAVREAVRPSAADKMPKNAIRSSSGAVRPSGRQRPPASALLPLQTAQNALHRAHCLEALPGAQPGAWKGFQAPFAGPAGPPGAAAAVARFPAFGFSSKGRLGHSQSKISFRTSPTWEQT